MKKLPTSLHLATLTLLVIANFFPVPSHATPGYYPKGVYPDFNNYKTINVRGKIHYQPAFPGNGAIVWFTTPDAVNCNAEENAGVLCGKAPHTPYKTINHQPSSSAFTITIDNYSSSVRASAKKYNIEDRPAEGRLIHSGEKFIFGDLTCAVGVNHLFSCQEGSHGFVLQTTGDSWVI